MRIQRSEPQFGHAKGCHEAENRRFAGRHSARQKIAASRQFRLGCCARTSPETGQADEGAGLNAWLGCAFQRTDQACFDVVQSVHAPGQYQRRCEPNFGIGIIEQTQIGRRPFHDGKPGGADVGLFARALRQPGERVQDTASSSAWLPEQVNQEWHGERRGVIHGLLMRDPLAQLAQSPLPLRRMLRFKVANQVG